MTSVAKTFWPKIPSSVPKIPQKIPPPNITQNLTPLTVFIAFLLINAAKNFNFELVKIFINGIFFSSTVFYLIKKSHPPKSYPTVFLKIPTFGI